MRCACFLTLNSENIFVLFADYHYICFNLSIKMTVTDEVRFCVKYLKDQGIGLKEIAELYKDIHKFRKNYRLVEVKADFFNELAEGLRELWPPGNKSGKYPWRDSKETIAARLQLLWSVRELPDVTVDYCLSVARRYVNGFKDDTTFMRTLKYYIIKTTNTIEGSTRKKQYDSPFADMLVGAKDEDAVQNEIDKMLLGMSYNIGGELV